MYYIIIYIFILVFSLYLTIYIIYYMIIYIYIFLLSNFAIPVISFKMKLIKTAHTIF